MKLPFAGDEAYAVLVIDMQKDGLEPQGAIFAEGGFEIIENIKRLTTLARNHNWPILHSQHVHRPDLSDFGISGYFEPPNCIEGSPGMQFVAQMEPSPDDVVIRKRRYSAFHGTDLDLVLRSLEVKGLFVCGVLTDACVLSTIVDARSRDYKVWLIADALSGTRPELHDATLAVSEGYLADIIDVERASAMVEEHTQTEVPVSKTTR